MSGTTLNSPINTYLPLYPNTDDPKLYGQLNTIYIAIRNLQDALGVYTGATVDNGDTPEHTIKIQNFTQCWAVAGEAIAYGDMCYVQIIAGVLTAKRANATFGSIQPAHCFCNVQGGLANGVGGFFTFGLGLCTGLSGLGAGSIYYVDPANIGKLTAVKPSRPNMIQQVGVALSTTSFFFMMQMPVDQTRLRYEDI